MPTTVLWACTFSASLQYCARTDEVAASRSGVLARRARLRVGELGPRVARLAADAAGRGGERDQDRDRHECERPEQAAAGQRAACARPAGAPS